MVHDALDAFVDLDVDGGPRRVPPRRRSRSTQPAGDRRAVRDDAGRGPDLVEPALHVFSISRHVERIADCATNIAEDVIYLVEGEIARHHFVELRSIRRRDGK